MSASAAIDMRTLAYWKEENRSNAGYLVILNYLFGGEKMKVLPSCTYFAIAAIHFAHILLVFLQVVRLSVDANER